MADNDIVTLYCFLYQIQRLPYLERVCMNAISGKAAENHSQSSLPLQLNGNCEIYFCKTAGWKSFVSWLFRNWTILPVRHQWPVYFISRQRVHNQLLVVVREKWPKLQIFRIHLILPFWKKQRKIKLLKEHKRYLIYRRETYLRKRDVVICRYCVPDWIDDTVLIFRSSRNSSFLISQRYNGLQKGWYWFVISRLNRWSVDSLMMKVLKAAQIRVKNLLIDTVTLLCKNGLDFRHDLKVILAIGSSRRPTYKIKNNNFPEFIYLFLKFK